MSLSAKLRRAPLRLATGAYLLNSGVGKLNADDETAKSLHGMASGTYPVLGKLEPKVYARTLAVGEIAVGTTLLLPIVPPFIAGAALAGFSGALLNMYWHTPGMHYEGSLRPTAQGTAISKDVWMLGIGLALMTDAALESTREGVEEIEASIARRRAVRGRQARRLARRTRRTQIADAESVKHLAQRADEASEATATRLGEFRRRVRTGGRREGAHRRRGGTARRRGVRTGGRREGAGRRPRCAAAGNAGPRTARVVTAVLPDEQFAACRRTPGNRRISGCRGVVERRRYAGRAGRPGPRAVRSKVLARRSAMLADRPRDGVADHAASARCPCRHRNATAEVSATAWAALS
jgi:uncharacterized membrane protein YphA (DoxX/SURF4 family)